MSEPAPTAQRFAMVCPHYYPMTCGIADFTMHLSGQLIRRGAEVALFTHLPAEVNPEYPGIAVHGFPGRTPLPITRGIRESLQAFDPTDVVIHYMPHMLGASRFGSLAIPLFMADMRARARVTVVLHELYLPWGWRPDLAVAAALQRVQLAATMGAADRIFVTTATRRHDLQALLHKAGRDQKVELIYVGANANPSKPTRQDGSRRLGIFSMLGKLRRFDLMIEAFGLIGQAVPDAELVLIGNLGTGASPRFRELKAQIAASPLAHRIALTGSLPLRRVAEEIAGLDLYLFPDEAGASTRSSTLPIAFGSGIPVVATCGPDTEQDLFVDGVNLSFAQSMSAEALAAAALRVLNEPAWAARLSEGGRALYERHLSWPAIADRLMPRPASPHVDA